MYRFDYFASGQVLAAYYFYNNTYTIKSQWMKTLNFNLIHNVPRVGQKFFLQSLIDSRSSNQVSEIFIWMSVLPDYVASVHNVWHTVMIS